MKSLYLKTISLSIIFSLFSMSLLGHAENNETIGVQNHTFINEEYINQQSGFQIALYTKLFTMEKSTEFLLYSPIEILEEVQNFLKEQSTSKSTTTLEDAQIELIRSAKRFSEVNIYEYLSLEPDRDRALKNFLIIAKNLSLALNREEQYFQSSITTLESKVNDANNKIKTLQTSLQSALEQFNTTQIKTYSDQKVEIKYQKAKNEEILIKTNMFLSSITPIKKKIDNKVILIEQNYKALLFDITVEGL